jgi:hypothetical protein
MRLCLRYCSLLKFVRINQFVLVDYFLSINLDNLEPMISPSTTTSPSNNRSRVKLYTLNEERQWDDRGTGFVTCTTPTPPAISHAIIVKSEVDGSTLLDSKIQLTTKYQKQQVCFIDQIYRSDHRLLFDFFFLGNIDCVVRGRKI